MDNSRAFIKTQTLLKLFPNDIEFSDEVSIISSGSKPKPAYLVIHSSGIYLFTIRSFPKRYQLSEQIAYPELCYMELTSNSLLLKSRHSVINFMHPNIINLSFIICTTRETLFKHPGLPFSVKIHQNFKSDFEQQFYTISKENIPQQRFLSCVARVQPAFEEEQLTEMIAFFKKTPKSLLFHTAFLNDPLARPACEAIAFGNEIEEIHFKGLVFTHFLPFFRLFLKHGQSISHFIFDSIEFDLKNLPKDIFGGELLNKANSYEFCNCHFISNESAKMFEAFSNYNHSIESLSFINCTFSDSSLDALFQTLFFSSCFHSLNTLRLSTIKMPQNLQLLLFQLVNSGWVLEKRCLKTLSIVNCDLQLPVFLPNLLRFDSGIRDLILTSNYFPERMETIDLHSITFLDVSGCVFTRKSLISFFTTLSHQKRSIKVSCAKLSIDPEELKQMDFQISIEALTSLCWDQNPVNESFFEFLDRQPSLQELSISNCIQESDLGMLKRLGDFVVSKQLSALRIKGTDEHFYGERLIPFLGRVLGDGSLNKLDITNQKIGDMGMTTILSSMTPSLHELYFDKFNPSNAEFLITACSDILLRPYINFASWPESDVMPVVSRTNRFKRDEIVRRIDLVKSQFSVKYGKRSSSGRNVKSNGGDDNGMEKKKEVQATIGDNFERVKEFVDYDEATIEGLRMVSPVQGSDPLEAALIDLEAKTKVEALLDELKMALRN